MSQQNSKTVIRILSVWLMVCAGVASAADTTAVTATVVTSIRPLQWLVEALVPPNVQVQTLLPQGQSVHDYVLRPADVVTVRNSALLVWVGPAMEPWLLQLSQQIPAADALALLPNAKEHDHDHDHDNAHDEPTEDAVSNALTVDPHIWLDPLAMAHLAEKVAARLQQRMPEQSLVVQQNLVAFQQDMKTLDAELQSQFAPLQQVGFVVYHDSYGPLVARYHLNQRAAIWHHETMVTGVRDRANMIALLKSGAIACVFYEPEYGREAVESWLAQTSTGVKVAELDPQGSFVTVTNKQYVHFMHALANGISDCLKPRATLPQNRQE